MADFPASHFWLEANGCTVLFLISQWGSHGNLMGLYKGNITNSRDLINEQRFMTFFLKRLSFRCELFGPYLAPGCENAPRFSIAVGLRSKKTAKRGCNEKKTNPGTWLGTSLTNTNQDQATFKLTNKMWTSVQSWNVDVYLWRRHRPPNSHSFHSWAQRICTSGACRSQEGQVSSHGGSDTKPPKNLWRVPKKRWVVSDSFIGCNLQQASLLQPTQGKLTSTLFWGKLIVLHLNGLFK